MLRRNLIPVWIGLIFLSGMFLMGQDTWGPQTCVDNDGDGYGNPANQSCAYPDLDCNDTDPAVNPGVAEAPYGSPICCDGLDNDCDGATDVDDADCRECNSQANCDDGNPCTDDYCLLEGTCVHAENADACDDGNDCTLGDTCSAGACAGTPRDQDDDGYGDMACGGTDCDDLNAAVHPGAIESPPGDPTCSDGLDNDCDGMLDSADPGCWFCLSAGDCDDGNLCTDDACVDHACLNANNANPCDDGNVCTTGDACSGGLCVGGLPLDCDDGNVCTDDSCDVVTGCGHANNTGPCEDGVACTIDGCLEGVCVGTPPDVDDDGHPDAACGGDDCDDSQTDVYPEAPEICDGFDNQCPGDAGYGDVDEGCPRSPPPDTGITQCYDNTVAIECPAPGQPFYGQDAQYVTNPMSYTVSPDGLTVTDNVTGLEWQREDDNTTRTWENSTSYCEGLGLADHADWRLPNVHELQSIVDYGQCNPAIDSSAFQGTNMQYYWSSSSSARYTYTNYAWVVGFSCGIVNDSHQKDTLDYVRCVRGEETSPSSFMINPEGTVTDNSTRLIWQREDDGVARTWENAISYCEGLGLAGHTDWRLPDIRELRSIVDETRDNPAINPAFVVTLASGYWSSSTSAYSASIAWYVSFSGGSNGDFDKTSSQRFVRCVR